MSNPWLPSYSPLQRQFWAVIKHGAEQHPSRHRQNIYQMAEMPQITNTIDAFLRKKNKKIVLDNNMARKSYKNKSRKRVYRRRRAYRKKPVITSLVPSTKLVKLRSVQLRTNSNMTSGAIEAVTVQMNSILDPFTGMGTEQPLGFDQLRALYNNGYVVGAKLTVQFHNTDAISYMVGVTPMPVSQGTTTLTNYEHYKECRGTKDACLTSDVDKITLVSKINLKKWLKVSKFRDTNEYRMDLNTPSEPSKACYFHLWTQPMDQASSDTTGVHMVMTAEYVVLLTNPVVPARSTA